MVFFKKKTVHVSSKATHAETDYKNKEKMHELTESQKRGVARLIFFQKRSPLIIIGCIKTGSSTDL